MGAKTSVPIFWKTVVYALRSLSPETPELSMTTTGYHTHFGLRTYARRRLSENSEEGRASEDD